MTRSIGPSRTNTKRRRAALGTQLTLLALGTLGTPRANASPAVSLPDTTLNASCRAYRGTARLFRIPEPTGADQIFQVDDRRGDGRTFTLQRPDGTIALPVGVPGAKTRDLKAMAGVTTWVDDGGVFLSVGTAKPGRITFRYCIYASH